MNKKIIFLSHYVVQGFESQMSFKKISEPNVSEIKVYII